MPRTIEADRDSSLNLYVHSVAQLAPVRGLHYRLDRKTCRIAGTDRRRLHPNHRAIRTHRDNNNSFGTSPRGPALKTKRRPLLIPVEG
jgi:hypothetical protein